MILLTDEEIQAITTPARVNMTPLHRAIAKAQLKKVHKDLTDILEDPAYHNHYIAGIWNYLQALLKEIEL